MPQRQFTVEHKPTGKKHKVVVPEVNSATGKPYTDDEIADILGKAARGISTTSPMADMTRYFGQGATKGMTQLAGAPVDLAAAGLNLAGMDIQRPIGGSQQLGEMASKTGLTYPDISQVPEAYRPFARAGETMGESTLAAGIPLAKGAQLGTKASTGVLAPMIEPARTKPMQTALAELGAATGASMGSGIAEQVAPDSPLARAGGEVAGGVLSPVAILTKTGSKLTQSLRNNIGQIKAATGSEAAIKQKAADELQMAVEGLGEGAESIAQSLEGPSPVRMTSGAKAQSVALMALERKLIANSQKYGVEQSQQLKQTIDELNQLIRTAEQSGNPQALKMAAQAKRNWYNAILESRVAEAQQAGRDLVSKAGPTMERAAAGEKARKILSEALGDARETEGAFWGAVDKDVPFDPDTLGNTAAAYKTVQERLAPNEPLGLKDWIVKNLQGWAEEGAEVSSGDLLRTRSSILREMRNIEGSQAPDWSIWGRLDEIQRGIMDDLAAQDAAAEEAREFSRALNRNFTHSESVRNTLGKHPGGGERVDPSLTLEKTLGPGEGPQRAVAAREFEQAATPIEGMAPNPARVTEMRAVQTEKIRDLAVVATTKNGEFDPDSLKAWRQKNRELLALYPEIDMSLKDAETASRVYGSRVKKLLEGDRIAKSRSAFSQVLDAGENPELVIGTAARGDTPYRDLTNIFKLTVGNKAAKEGASASSWKYLFDNSATTHAGQRFVSGQKLLDNLDSNKALLAAGKRYGLWNDTTIHNTRKLAQEMAKLENYMKFTGQLDYVVSEPSAFLDLAARLVGANIGGHSMMSQASGASLVMAHAGSRYMRSLVEKLPMMKVEHILQEAVNDPNLMIELLRKPRSASVWQKTAKKLDKSLSKIRPMEMLGESLVSPPVGYKLQLAVPAGYEVQEQSPLSPPVR